MVISPGDIFISIQFQGDKRVILEADRGQQGGNKIARVLNI